MWLLLAVNLLNQSYRGTYILHVGVDLSYIVVFANHKNDLLTIYMI